MIGIIDYGMGNLHSVSNALKYLGQDYIISSDPSVLKTADKLILPGVGSFADCMKNLAEMNLVDFIKSEVNEKKKPLLGICLGMQALFESSTEHGITQGFGFLKGQIDRMEDMTVRIPHIGWNDIIMTQEHELFQSLSKKPFVYYVHSYCAKNYEEKDLLGYSKYGNLIIPGIVCHDNVLGCQFHPEKSAQDGLEILRYFVKEF